ncbi:hypothetical protein [Marinospirillum sp.]|uniref:hypothetical protein n=1 Tax=Marinospirillum sp. TaxID=2183934 RepID=UPI00384DCB9B
MKKLLMAVLAVVFVTGCTSTQRMGDFTAASSQNVRNLDYSVAEGSSTRVKGETCVTYVWIFKLGPSDAQIQRAMDDAISNGRDSGLDGDLLVNVRIENEIRNLPLYNKQCVVVSGDLVSIAP